MRDTFKAEVRPNLSRARTFRVGEGFQEHMLQGGRSHHQSSLFVAHFP